MAIVKSISTEKGIRTITGAGYPDRLSGVTLINGDQYYDEISKITYYYNGSWNVKSSSSTAKSNYDLWIEAGNSGSLSDYFASLQGKPGITTVYRETVEKPGAGLGYTAENVAKKDTAGGYAGLDENSKMNPSQLPALAVIEYLGIVATEAAMLSLTGQKGDWCIRSDQELHPMWMITGSDSSLLAGWTAVPYPAVPTLLSQLGDDSTHRLVTDALISAWNAKANTGDIPTLLSQLTGDSTHRIVTDIEKSGWDAKEDKTPFMLLDSNYTTGNNSDFKKLFNNPTNGRFTTGTNKKYSFDIFFTLSSMGTGTFSFGFLGTAVITDISYTGLSQKGSNLGVQSPYCIGQITSASASVIVASTGGAMGWARLKGVITITTSGTLIPAFSTSTAAAAVVGKGSWFEIKELGSNTTTYYGAFD